jgi:predicted solute-binding protein
MAASFPPFDSRVETVLGAHALSMALPAQFMKDYLRSVRFSICGEREDPLKEEEIALMGE